MKFFSICLLLFFTYAKEFDFKSLSGDFTQNLKQKNAILNFKGKFYFKDQKAAWFYSEPNIKKVYFDGKNTTIIEDDLEQVIIYKSNKTINLQNIFKKAKKIKENQYKANFDGIDFFISIENSLPKQINYKDELGSDIKIILNNIKKNSSLKDEIFNAEIPKNYDLITQ